MGLTVAMSRNVTVCAALMDTTGENVSAADVIASTSTTMITSTE